MMEEKDNVLRNIVGFDAVERDSMSRGVISEMAEIRRLNTDELVAKKLIYPGMKQRDILNSFREIRTKLLQQSPKENFVVLVSSICEGGGRELRQRQSGGVVRAGRKQDGPAH